MTDTTKREHLDLLCDIGDLANLLSGSTDIANFLNQTVQMVARHLGAPVCSIYLYNEKSEESVLRATVGLNPGAVNRIRLRTGEGLVGSCLARMRPVIEGDALNSPDFKYFSVADEDRYASFVAVPMVRGDQPIGVLTVQHEENDYFTDADIRALRATASQLAGAVENARLLMGLDQEESGGTGSGLTFIKGEAASGGFACAPVTVLQKSQFDLMDKRFNSSAVLCMDDFQKAVSRTEDQLNALQQGVSERLPESAALIFTAHFMILKDPGFIAKMAEKIEAGSGPVDAVRDVAGHYIEVFSKSPSPYIREKATDVADLAARILRNLLPGNRSDMQIDGDRIVIARELFPSDMLKLASGNVKGIVLVGGGSTSHVAILARSLRIPLIFADTPALLNITDGTSVLLDADHGSIFVEPSKSVLAEFELRNKTRKTVDALSDQMRPETFTTDGTRITLLVNINLLSQIELSKKLKAEGIGLYRTEFPFLIRSTFPTEAEQTVVYRRLIEEMGDQEVTIRTLDVGGDKTLSYANAGGGANPELGLRSIRFSLTHRDIFEQQIRAILRASADRETIRIMFPMISSLDEFLEARAVVLDCIEDLNHEGLPHHDMPEIGMMVEIPSVVETIDAYARVSDFFSIGTNDFIQYMLAVDRTNEKVASYYRAYHPAVLRGLNRVVRAVQAAGKPISVCGEMAHEPEYIPFLLGIGIRRLSVDPQFLPSVQAQVQSLDISGTEDFAAALLKEDAIRDVHRILTEFLSTINCDISAG